MSRHTGVFAFVAISLTLLVTVVLFATGALTVPWSNGCGPYLDVNPVTDVSDDATVVSYDSLSPEEQAVFDDALAAESMGALDDRPWSAETGYVERDGTTYETLVAVC